MSKAALALMNALMSWRARGLMARVVPLLAPAATVLDIGSGTGHNAQRLRRLGLGPVVEADVVAFNVVGPGPTLFDGRALPFADGQFDAVMLIYVLRYTREPAALLREARRVGRGPVIVVQTVCAGSGGVRCHHWNEVLSRLGFCAARFARAIPAAPCPLHSRRDLTRAAFLSVARQAGLAPRELRAERQLPFLPLIRITCRLDYAD